MKSLPKLLSRGSPLKVCGLVPSVENLLPQRLESLLKFSGLHPYDDQLSVKFETFSFCFLRYLVVFHAF